MSGDRADITALLADIPALCAPYIETAAVPGTPAWFVAVAAANLRDAAGLLHDTLQDL